MKKRLVLCVTAVFAILALIFVWYFASTKSPIECIEYCRKNTKREATSFCRIGDGRYIEDYAYWIAEDGDPSKSQEIFIFKRKNLGPLEFDRYEFVLSSVQNTNDCEETKVGSVQFFTRKDNGDKETNSTLLFYGATADSDIQSYQYKITQAGELETHQGKILKTDSVWILKIFDLGNGDENNKRQITEVNFFDSDEKLIYSY